MKKKIKYKALFGILVFFIFISAIFLVSKSFTYYASNVEKQNEIIEINQKIAELEEMKRGYKAKALNHVNQAETLQFISGELQTAKKHWKLADDNGRIAKQIQKQIDELKIQKNQIQKNYS